VTVCISYAQISYGDESNLRLFHYEQGAWVDRTISLDTVNKVVCASVAALSPFAILSPLYSATVRPPIHPDGSSVFSVDRGVVPVKFALAVDGVRTCSLPPATIAVYRMGNAGRQKVDEAECTDRGPDCDCRIVGCLYHYNLRTRPLGRGMYRVDLSISTSPVGSARFRLR
jgi:hypothetical protein